MKLREILTTASFCLVIFVFAVAHLLSPDKDVSVTERRPLQQFPEFSTQTVMNGNFGNKLETYLLDQFPLRNNLRTLKAFWHFDVYQQSDNNGIYLVGDQICKLDKVLREDQVNGCINNTNRVYNKYLQDMNVFFALIPDKNYFVAEKNGYPALDYSAMNQMLKNGLNSNIQYLGMEPFSTLDITDYYNTDLHWRQENLQPVVEALGDAMNFATPNWENVVQTSYSPFYGSYYGQSALGGPADTLITVSTPTTDGAIVTGLEFEGEKPVYEPTDFHEMDGYDVFLGGPQGIVFLENPNGTTGKELVIFRDSFTSSLSPLLLDGYDKITLIDLRYMSSANLSHFIEFTDQDILFLYSTGIVNNGKLLK